MKDPKQDEGYDAAVRRRVARMQRARRERSGWQHLAHVGVLAWTFLLPTLGGVALGRVLARFAGVPSLALVGLSLGLAAGGYAAWRQVRKSLEDDETEAP